MSMHLYNLSVTGRPLPFIEKDDEGTLRGGPYGEALTGEALTRGGALTLTGKPLPSIEKDDEDLTGRPLCI